MSFTRIVIAALVLAAALPASAAGAQDLRSPDASSLQMQVQRDRNAPDPPQIVQDLRTSNTGEFTPPPPLPRPAAPSHGSPSASGDAFPWLEAGLLAAVALMLVGASLVVSRRRRLATRA
jgi:hypothetical protein